MAWRQARTEVHTRRRLTCATGEVQRSQRAETMPAAAASQAPVGEGGHMAVHSGSWRARLPASTPPAPWLSVASRCWLVCVLVPPVCVP
eukprot:5358429-Prymnesium_polylepis.1